MTTCDYCTQAQIEPHYPLYRAQCRGCRVRGLAAGPDFWLAAKTARLTADYQRALKRLFGEDWQAAHAEVKAEAERLKALAAGDTA